MVPRPGHNVSAMGPVLDTVLSGFEESGHIGINKLPSKSTVPICAIDNGN